MKLSNLANVLRAAGLTVVETPGWATRGYAGQDLTEIRGVLYHHTATASARNTLTGAPTLQMTLNGRSDLAGPLCNITFGRDGTVYLVAAGVANHAGRGSAPGIPKDTGNHYLIGIEMESSGVAPWDWTLDQIRVAPHLGAAIERAYLQGIPEDMRLQLGHKEYSSEGKIDPAGWPGDMNGLRAAINNVLNGSAAIAPQGDIKTGGLTVADIDSISKQLADIQAKLAPINTAAGQVDLRQFIADGTRAAQAAEKQTAPINVSGGQEGIRDFIAKGTRAAQGAEARLAALEATLAKAVATPGTDLATLTAAAEAGASKALSNLTATTTFEKAGK